MTMNSAGLVKTDQNTWVGSKEKIINDHQLTISFGRLKFVFEKDGHDFRYRTTNHSALGQEPRYLNLV